MLGQASIFAYEALDLLKTCDDTLFTRRDAAIARWSRKLVQFSPQFVEIDLRQDVTSRI